MFFFLAFVKNLGIGGRDKYFACFTYFIYATDTRRVANGIIINTNDNSNG